MSTTRDLQDLGGHHRRHTPVDGDPTRIWHGDIRAVEPDGTVTVAPVYGRAGKVNVPCPDTYVPRVGDRVLCGDVNGDRQTPIVIAVITRSAGPPVITGSRASGAALTNLLAALAAAHIIVDHTTA